jgi:hypothetical protein
MAHPDTHKPYKLYTDACDYAIGGILCQVDRNGIERPIQYISSGLSSTQKRWATIEKEAFAVIYCLKKLRPYLLGAEFQIFTDHKPLLCLFTKEMDNTKIQRWAVLIAEFGAKIEYRKGANNIRADMLSRIQNQNETGVIDVDDEWLEDPVLEDVLKPSEVDDLDDDTVKLAQQRQFPEEMASQERDKFIVIEGFLYSTSRPGQGQARYPRLMLPTEFTEQVVVKCHAEAGHSGVRKTLARIQEQYVWPGMRKQVEIYVGRCGLCLVNLRREDKPPMGEMPIAKGPGQIVGLDLMGPLVPSDKGNKYLLVIIDHYSGWIEAYPIASKCNDTIVERLANDYIPRHGSPRVAITDCGPEFRTREFEEWLTGNGIERRRTSGYNPQSNGKTERANGTLRRMLEKLVNGNRPKWEDRLGTALIAVRNNVSDCTGFAPFMLHHARPSRQAIGRFADGALTATLSDRLRTQAEVTALAIANIAKSRERNRERLANAANACDLQVGDQVLIKGQRMTPLTAKWDFGYVITAIRGKVITVLHEASGKTLRYNRNKVKYVDPDAVWDGVKERPRVRNVAHLQVPDRHPPRPEVPIPNFRGQRKRKANQEVDEDYQPPRTRQRCRLEEGEGEMEVACLHHFCHSYLC